MYTFSVVLLVFAGLAASSPSAPFAIAQSTFGPIQASLINNDIQSYLATVTADSAFKAASAAFATATDAGLIHEFRGNPNQLAIEYYTATATPTWFSELPDVLKSYVQYAGSAQAAIESSDAAKSVNEATSTTTGSAPATTTSGKSDADMRRMNTIGMGVGLAAGVIGVAVL